MLKAGTMCCAGYLPLSKENTQLPMKTESLFLRDLGFVADVRNPRLLIWSISPLFRRELSRVRVCWILVLVWVPGWSRRGFTWCWCCFLQIPGHEWSQWCSFEWSGQFSLLADGFGLTRCASGLTAGYFVTTRVATSSKFILNKGIALCRNLFQWRYRILGKSPGNFGEAIQGAGGWSNFKQ